MCAGNFSKLDVYNNVYKYIVTVFPRENRGTCVFICPDTDCANTEKAETKWFLSIKGLRAAVSCFCRCNNTFMLYYVGVICDHSTGASKSGRFNDSPTCLWTILTCSPAVIQSARVKVSSRERTQVLCSELDDWRGGCLQHPMREWRRWLPVTIMRWR